MVDFVDTAREAVLIASISVDFSQENFMVFCSFLFLHNGGKGKGCFSRGMFP